MHDFLVDARCYSVNTLRDFHFDFPFQMIMHEKLKKLHVDIIPCLKKGITFEKEMKELISICSINILLLDVSSIFQNLMIGSYKKTAE